jgi:leader peptidase (prepilin peptidase) / N-methyltransferase
MIVASLILLAGVMEAVTTIAVFAAVVAVRGVDLTLVLELPFAAVLVAVAAIDLEHRIVPNKIVAPAAVIALVAVTVVAPEDVVEHLAAGGIAFAVLLLLALAYPGGLGMGDVRLAGVMGLYLGVSLAPSLLAAFLAGSLCGLLMMARHGTAARKRALPFAPFLALGGLVGLLAGPELVDRYVQRFF